MSAIIEKILRNIMSQFLRVAHVYVLLLDFGWMMFEVEA